MIDGAEVGEENRNLNGKYICGERIDGSEVGEVNEKEIKKLCRIVGSRKF